MSPIQLVRIGIPGAMLLMGVVLLFIPDEFANGAGVVLIGSSVLVGFANGLLRFSLAEMEDRNREQAAREHYHEHGRWPEDPDPSAEAEPAPPTPTAPEAEHAAPAPHPGADARPLEGRPARGRRRRRPPRRPEG
jgi:hypothetical protein